MTDRRQFLAGAAALLAAPAFGAAPDPFAALEPAGARLGVALLDSATGRIVGRRLDERFPMCSTFKALAAGLVLRRVEAGLERLERLVPFTKADLVSYSPVTTDFAGKGMTIGALCEAGLTRSDNTAANLLLASFGGPAAIGRFARTLGDDVTRLDRTETSLNEATPGDPRDTTSPRAMAGDLRRLLLGGALKPASRDQLAAWMIANKTGDARLRAGLPKDWRIGDKTGSGDHGTANDVAILWPPHRAPLIVAAYLTGGPDSLDARSAVLAKVGEVIAAYRRG